MKTILNTSTDPYFNLALEEYLVKNLNFNEDFFILWQNSPSVIIGRNQNVFEEIDIKLAIQKGIPFVRRISGGGTVFHDLGNLNFTFITKNKGLANNYKVMTEKIVTALNKIGIPIGLVGKSDLKIGHEKISGNAQFVYKDVLLHHGTLLFDSNLTTLKKLLRPKKDDVLSHSVKSNRSEVTNLSQFTHLSLEEIKEYLYVELMGNDYKKDALSLSSDVLDQVNDLKNEKYLSWEWNYAESPSSMIKKNKDDLHMAFTVEQGVIKSISITKKDLPLTEIETLLLEKKVIPGELKSLLINHLDVYDCLLE